MSGFLEQLRKRHFSAEKELKEMASRHDQERRDLAEAHAKESSEIEAIIGAYATIINREDDKEKLAQLANIFDLNTMKVEGPVVEQRVVERAEQRVVQRAEQRVADEKALLKLDSMKRPDPQPQFQPLGAKIFGSR